MNNKQHDVYDIAIVGGGINGCGIARDAAGRGLKTFLCDMGDLGSATSSGSTKLIHGGLRYLEHLELTLVRKALKEREVILKIAPHITRPLTFVLPHTPNLRPKWVLRLGLFLYDNLAARVTLPGSKQINLHHHIAGAPLKKEFETGFTYSDVWVDDARLVLLNALDAHNHGATIAPHQKCTKVSVEHGLWKLSFKGKANVYAKTLVNAAGPWADSFLEQTTKEGSPHKLRLVKGSHIILPKLFDHDNAYIFQNADERITFAIPYEENFTLVGTTDVELKDDPSRAKCSKEEQKYLLDSLSKYFKKNIEHTDIKNTYSAVRPILDESESSASKASRDYKLELEEERGAPLLSVWGGKITTYRLLAEEALKMLSPHTNQPRKEWTATSPLPGGELSKEACKKRLRKSYPWLPEELTKRYTRSYGTLCEKFLEGKTSLRGLGKHFGAGLYKAEVDYLQNHEWAHTAEDILHRRTKLELHMSEQEKKALSTYLEGSHSLASAKK